MNESKFTPGPWELNLADDHSYILRGGKTIACVDTWMDDEQEANANLIAAAPDLLEALIELHKIMDFEAHCEPREPYCFDDPSGINAAYDLAYAAINKAKGQL